MQLAPPLLIKRPVAFCVTGFLLLLLSMQAMAKQDAEILAPGYSTLKYDAPAVGSYSLPVIDLAGDGNVLNVDKESLPLHDLMGDKIVLMSFIYTMCGDINGCPLATFVMSRVQNKLREQNALNDEVRFISVSFDPANDTPDRMYDYGGDFADEEFDWQFITTSSETELNPILRQYQQSVLKELDENGEETGVISHILRVFLIDRDKQIRNIYSTSFLHPDTLINDMKTLALEGASQEGASPKAVTTAPTSSTVDDGRPRLHGAGDDKGGYEKSGYQTGAQSLVTRTGKPADLLKAIRKAPLGLPKLQQDPGNRITRAKVALGRELFYDRRLSHNNTFSCAMCHIPEQGFTSNELATAVGIEGRTVRRNAPSLYNIVYADTLFHDGRENSLEQQIWSPLLAHNEMGNPAVGRVIDKIKAIPAYVKKFKAAFGGDGPDIKNVGQAIASYERTLVSGNSAFDRWFYGGKENALSADAKAGHTLFAGKAGCVTCHSISDQHALFTDHKLHNTGIGYHSSMMKQPATREVLIAPGTWLTVDTASIADSSEKKPNDLGRYEITEDPADRWKYRTPMLRNVALSAPYMHDGSLLTLRDVVEFYNRGGVANELLDPLVRPLGLSAQQVDQLVSFLQSLTGDNVDELISDAFAAPVGNVD